MRRVADGKGQLVFQRWALNTGAILGSLCLLMAALMLVFGLKPLIFASGSMGPYIPTGALGLAVPMPDVEVAPGQVVSVVTTDGTRVTHRVIENSPQGLVLKGDANSVADLQPYSVSTADRLLISVPVLGYVVSWFNQPWAFFVGGLFCAYLLYLAFFRRDSYFNPSGDSLEPRSGIANRARRGKSTEPSTLRRTLLRVGTIVTTLAVVVPLGAVNSVERTQAAWSSTSTAVAPIKAATMLAATNLRCTEATSGNKSVTISWAAPNASPLAVEQYRITVTAGGNSKTVTVSADATSQVLSLEEDKTGLLGGLIDILGGLVQFLLGDVQTIGVSVVAVYPGDWKSEAVSKSNIAKITPVLLSARIDCTEPTI